MSLAVFLVQNGVSYSCYHKSDPKTGSSNSGPNNKTPLLFRAEELDFEPNAFLSYVPRIVFFALSKNLNLRRNGLVCKDRLREQWLNVALCLRSYMSSSAMGSLVVTDAEQLLRIY